MGTTWRQALQVILSPCTHRGCEGKALLDNRVVLSPKQLLISLPGWRTTVELLGQAIFLACAAWSAQQEGARLPVSPQASSSLLWGEDVGGGGGF